MFLKPSTLIALLIVLIFILLAFCPNQNQSFLAMGQDAIKVLCGALAGAVAGERYGKK